VRHAYPLLLDVTNRLVVIIGGGGVAARKARGILSAGGKRVRCVAPHVVSDFPAEAERIAQEYDASQLDGADLVFAATDNHVVNDAVVRDCRQRGIWVNRADSDDEAPGDFVTPAKWEQGPVIVTVSAGSAALAAALRDQIAGTVDKRYVQMAQAMQELRPMILGSASLDAAGRAAIFRELAGPEALALLDTQRIDRLRQWLAQRLKQE
jgi:precorrin-2 dehydrogenase / sirohydrochlorin ferrochelatase